MDPGRASAARLLSSLEPPAWFLRHACAVADVAAWLADRARTHGTGVDATAVAVAALLHDVDKLPGARLVGLRHGDGSAAWLTTAGHPELAPMVRDHPVTRLAEDGYEGWLDDASTEARIVAYADKRAGRHLESRDARFASWHRRYPGGWGPATDAVVRERARELEDDVCAMANVRPEDVRRLRWSRRALAAAA